MTAAVRVPPDLTDTAQQQHFGDRGGDRAGDEQPRPGSRRAYPRQEPACRQVGNQADRGGKNRPTAKDQERCLFGRDLRVTGP